MDKIATKQATRTSLSKQITDQIRQSILDGSLKVDQRLPSEDLLAKRYKVSRPTIREALKSLAAQKLIYTRRGPTGGSFVNQPSIDELIDTLAGCSRIMVGTKRFSPQEVNQARRLLVQLCCKLAAYNRNNKDIELLRLRLAEQENSSLTADEFCSADVAFYRVIIDATGNRMLSFIMSSVLESMQSIPDIVGYRFSCRQSILSEHHRMLSAIEQGEPELAASLASQQLDYLQSTDQTFSAA